MTTGLSDCLQHFRRLLATLKAHDTAPLTYKHPVAWRVPLKTSLQNSQVWMGETTEVVRAAARDPRIWCN